MLLTRAHFNMNFGRFVFSQTPIYCSRIFYRNFNKKTQKFDYKKLVKVNKQANRKPRLTLILKEDVSKLGTAGQMVQVKRGYGRNYLILNGLAVYATEENKEKYLKVQSKGALGKTVADPRILSFLESARLEIAVKASVDAWEITNHDVALECRKKLNIVVPAHCVQISEPITSFGDFTVGITINEYVTSQLKCSVVPLIDNVDMKS